MVSICAEISSVAFGPSVVYQRSSTSLFRLLSEGRLKPAVGKVFEFEDFREAFKTLAGGQALGKVVVRVGR
ncbi:zinc-binding dehydrogenase [Bradyrhizobium sp. CCBAU 53415]|uniref:zinc-binding dehydrogenase n=1 Tax=Bradyrhizobium sp. CCBAU 53415 TaxID=1325119 RepID=UPI00230592E0|nr:zinc-binding dehydrogenase [Bradyrhizobium sp. CCBAU 53415]